MVELLEKVGDSSAPRISRDRRILPSWPENCFFPLMKLPRLFALAALLLPALAQAHPGHEGHELTWDFDHLANHPLATLVCVGALTAAFWGVRELMHARRAKAEARTRRR